jgi:hypothetical protein
MVEKLLEGFKMLAKSTDDFNILVSANQSIVGAKLDFFKLIKTIFL